MMTLRDFLEYIRDTQELNLDTEILIGATPNVAVKLTEDDLETVKNQLFIRLTLG